MNHSVKLRYSEVQTLNINKTLSVCLSVTLFHLALIGCWEHGVMCKNCEGSHLVPNEVLGVGQLVC